MSVKNAIKEFGNTLSDIAWAQWKAVGGNAGNAGAVRNIVDPEALVCLSLVLHHYEIEPRALEVLYGWVNINSRILSLQRLRTLIKEYPEPVQKQLAHLAAFAQRKDPRWRSLATSKVSVQSPRNNLRATEPVLVNGPALMLKIRTVMGLTVKADILTILLGLKDAGATITELVDATHYTAVGVRQSADEMTNAGMLRVTTGRPARYYVEYEKWLPFLGTSVDIAWMPWHELFVFGARLVDWSEESSSTDSSYLQSRDLREIVTPVRNTTARIRLPLQDPGEFPGELYTEVFETDLDGTTKWLANLL